MKIETVYDNSWRNPSFRAPFRKPVKWYEQSDSDEPRAHGAGFTVEQLLNSLEGTKEQKTLRRTLQVQDKWRAAVEKVYGAAAPLVLSHTNAVYIMKLADYLARKGKGVSDVSRETSEQAQPEQPLENQSQTQDDPSKVLIVYVNDATVRADVDAKQELLKLQLLKNGEQITEMKILASRFGMKERNPYREYLQGASVMSPSSVAEPRSSVDISAESLSEMERILDGVTDPLVKARLEKTIARNLRPYMKEK